MSWNLDLNIYKLPVLSFSKFSIFEGRNQLTIYCCKLGRKLKKQKFYFLWTLRHQGFEGRMGRTNFGEKILYFPFSNGSLNSQLGLGVIFLLYGINIQCDFFQDFINNIFEYSIRFLLMYQFFHNCNKFNHVFLIVQMNL